MFPSVEEKQNPTSMTEGYTTIDDLKEQAEALVKGLTRLAGYKHPLSVRRGVARVGEEVDEVSESEQLKAGAKTYFFDIAKTKEGKQYLKITESRFKGEGKERERSTVIVFPEQAQEFAEKVAAAAKQIAA
jgi:hypothetical protein